MKTHMLGLPTWLVFAALSVFSLGGFLYLYFFHEANFSIFAIGWVGGGCAEMAAQFYRNSRKQAANQNALV